MAARWLRDGCVMAARWPGDGSRAGDGLAMILRRPGNYRLGSFKGHRLVAFVNVTKPLPMPFWGEQSPDDTKILNPPYRGMAPGNVTEALYSPQTRSVKMNLLNVENNMWGVRGAAPH